MTASPNSAHLLVIFEREMKNELQNASIHPVLLRMISKMLGENLLYLKSDRKIFSECVRDS